MIKVEFLITCENAFQTLGNNNLNLIGIFDVINAPGFPAAHPYFSVVAKVVKDEDTEHEISLKISKGTTVITQSPTVKFTDRIFQHISNMINFQFSEEGDYSVTVVLDGEDKETRHIKLNKVTT